MIIRLTDSRGNLFTQVNSFESANIAARAIWKKNNWSDIHYFIEFNDLQEVFGSIDIEPKEFFSRSQKNIITTHLKTFWNNIINATPEKKRIYKISNDDILFFKHVLKQLPNN